MIVRYVVAGRSYRHHLGSHVLDALLVSTHEGHGHAWHPDGDGVAADDLVAPHEHPMEDFKLRLPEDLQKRGDLVDIAGLAPYDVDLAGLDEFLAEERLSNFPGR